jgi:type II secretory pathway component PulM
VTICSTAAILVTFTGETFALFSVIVYLVIANPPLSLVDKALHVNFTELAVSRAALVAVIAKGIDCATAVAAVDATESSPRLLRAMTVKL